MTGAFVCHAPAVTTGCSRWDDADGDDDGESDERLGVGVTLGRLGRADDRFEPGCSVDREPRTDDAYVYADTIDVVPEVNGRIAELAVRDNQAVKQGDLLFQIDPRPYEDALTRAQASLVALDKQIALTHRTVNAQQYNAMSGRTVRR